ncbi:hypothetical protein [Burkholderia glumae]|uniref:hypothetical protein n=2 Tax=Burkholderia glumae TaxID=337 RepID=UPI000688F548|nr:hypothetical protein [Burkholderia glumae]
MHVCNIARGKTDSESSMNWHSSRFAYLRALWRADIDPLVFVGTARRLGYALGCHWDADAGMPVLTPIVLH